MHILWNPWHGCHKYSEGCKNCYVYRMDEKYDRDSSIVTKNESFYLPIQKNKRGEYKVKSGTTVNMCFSSDFLVEDADEWRKECFKMIKERSDLKFLFLTKRIERFNLVKPGDWGDGYDNVMIGCTCENQKMADFRLPIFNQLPIKHKCIVCEPLLEKIDLTAHLNNSISLVIAGGESGLLARPCNYTWITDLQQQCKNKQISFFFKQTGAKFIKDGKLYKVSRKFQHSQAKKAKINLNFTETSDWLGFSF